MPRLRNSASWNWRSIVGASHVTRAYGLELFRRATVEGDAEAWEWVQHCFGEIVHAWLRRHPSRATACWLESEANYVALAFERFWQATTVTQQVEFETLAAALRYLRASLHGAILDTLRAYERPKEVPITGARRSGRAIRGRSNGCQ